MEDQKTKDLEQIYQKMSQYEHVLHRPDCYIGSIESHEAVMWVHDGAMMVERKIKFIPGLYKIFDEILVNASDNKARDPTMNLLKVTIDPDMNLVKVWNNGQGIPVEIHKEQKMYIPEMIFGHLLTSSNYDDEEKKITGGRNGYGAKLTNIFSTEFFVETADGLRKKKFKQVFLKNMSERRDPEIMPCKASDNWTCISFKPDLKRFGASNLEQDMVDLMRKRVYDMAGIMGKTVKIYFNDELLPVNSFEDYVSAYVGPKPKDRIDRVYAQLNDRWELCITQSSGQFQQVSFVNGICTSSGGTHVNYVIDQISKFIVEKIDKKLKDGKTKAYIVKHHLWLFLRSIIENPSFDSQTKDALTTRTPNFSAHCQLPATFLEKIIKSAIFEYILDKMRTEHDKQLKKNDGAKKDKILGLAKLDDAQHAGKKYSEDCSLILTEGDSAKGLAMSGLNIIGRALYGVFPLKGKLLNVRDASKAAISKNSEITALKQILGLKHAEIYEDTKKLRYGHVIIMCDQDPDGSHIKGLLINFFHYHYPTLLRKRGFLQEFVTPLIKASKGVRKLSFYSNNEFNAWKESTQDVKSWNIKYYKGLGTSTPEEAKEYFSNFYNHLKDIAYEGVADDDAIDKAFSKNRSEDRKQWLGEYNVSDCRDFTRKVISISDFVNKELIEYSRLDLERSIPQVMDGLKVVQRKALFTFFKKNITGETKVAQLASSASALTDYHHGENSMASTIIGMAQNFVGSNNINLFEPAGQFGTRIKGGKDAASMRYIFSRLSKITRLIFHPDDDVLLTYHISDGNTIEPHWYVPIIPMCLVNGAEGIGTGWSTYIPNYNPKDIVDNILRMIEGQEPEEMTPWYKGFRGAITETRSEGSNATSRSFIAQGIYEKVEDDVVVISELPVKTWTEQYKEFLMNIAEGLDQSKKFFEDYESLSTDIIIHFKIIFAPGQLDSRMASPGFLDKLKISSKISTSNMTLFNADGHIRKYQSVCAILKAFYQTRLRFYYLRKQSLIKICEERIMVLRYKIKFIMDVIESNIIVFKRKKIDIEEDLLRMGYPKLAPLKKKEKEESDETASYAYLLSMKIESLTKEKVDDMHKTMNEEMINLNNLQETLPETMWRDDLNKFINEWEKFKDVSEEIYNKAKKQNDNCNNGLPKTKRGGGARNRGRGGITRVPANEGAVVDGAEDGGNTGRGRRRGGPRIKRENKKEEMDIDIPAEKPSLFDFTVPALAERLSARFSDISLASPDLSGAKPVYKDIEDMDVDKDDSKTNDFSLFQFGFTKSTDQRKRAFVFDESDSDDAKKDSSRVVKSQKKSQNEKLNKSNGGVQKRKYIRKNKANTKQLEQATKPEEDIEKERAPVSVRPIRRAAKKNYSFNITSDEDVDEEEEKGNNTTAKRTDSDSVYVISDQEDDDDDYNI